MNEPKRYTVEELRHLRDKFKECAGISIEEAVGASVFIGYVSSLQEQEEPLYYEELGVTDQPAPKIEPLTEISHTLKEIRDALNRFNFNSEGNLYVVDDSK